MFVSLICTSLILILYSSMSPSCSENLAILAFLGESSFEGFYNLTGQNKEKMCDRSPKQQLKNRAITSVTSWSLN